MFAFHSSGNDRSLILVMLLISQHATIFLNFQFPKSRAFYSPTHVPSQKNLEILLQSSVSLTSSETHLQKLAKPVKLRLFSSSTSSFYLHFKLENPFFFVQTSSSSLSKKKYCVFLPLQTSPQCSILLFYSSSYIPPVSTLLHSKTNFWISSRNPPTSHSGWLFSTFPPKLFNSPKNSTYVFFLHGLFLTFPPKILFF